MRKEEERARRRLRDREWRQSMTKEQREEHLARRRRNYRLRRQRATTNAPSIQPTTGEVGNSAAELQCLTPSNDTHDETETSQIVEGSSIQLESQPRRMRLTGIKRLARNQLNPVTVSPSIDQVPPELIPGSSGEGGTPKSLRLNRVKRIARSLISSSGNPAAQEDHNDTVGGSY